MISTPDYPAAKFPQISKADREMLQRLENSRRAVAGLIASQHPELFK